MEVKIKPYNNAYRQDVLAVWEASVLATHSFLHPYDFLEIKALVAAIDFASLQVYCLISNKAVLGFIGVAHRKVEMLFIDPAHTGRGLGKQLLQFAITALQANKLDVNEQNLAACGFYAKQGFEVYERTAKDDQGKPYPLLRMQLSNV